MTEEKKVEEPVEEKPVKAEAPKAEKEAPKEVKEAPKKEAPKEAKEEAPKAEAKAEKPAEKKEAPKAEKKGSTVESSGATPAQVVKVFRKVGLYGECYQVLARVLEGRDRGNLLRRNVRGPVKENDMLMLKETERDARAV